MRSYTEKDGTLVTVDEAHLKMAVEIKVELQKASPSHKCSWAMHKKLMQEEGFEDSSSVESYRQMIKSYQKSIGELPEAPKYAEMVSTSKIESIKELVGDMRFEKHGNQKVLREINKGKRELIDFAIIAEDIGNAFKEHDFGSMKFTPEEVQEPNERKMIVGLSDLHIGALVNTDINTYNYNVAIERMSLYASRILSEARRNNVRDLYVMNLGDVIEHATMRYSQGYNAEFTFSEQIVLASDLIINFLKYLAGQGFNITYAGIAGNHDRITDKDKNIDGDHVVKPINHAVKSFIQYSQIPNVKYEQAKDYGHSIEMNGRNIKFVHGDLDSLKDDSLVAKHSSLDGVNYDMVVLGHFHHFREMEVGFDKRVVVFGSLKGADDYGERIRKISVASQGLIIIDELGNIDVKRVQLK